MARSTPSSQALAEVAQERRKERLQERSKIQGDNNDNHDLQNKTLAKTNSILTAKISDMENRISDLINENVQLRSKSPDIDIKKTLEQKLDHLESELNQKIDEMHKILKDFRESEGLKSNNRTSGSFSKFLGNSLNFPSSSTRRYSFAVKKNRLQVFNDTSDELSLSQPITKKDYKSLSTDVPLDLEPTPTPIIESSSKEVDPGVIEVEAELKAIEVDQGVIEAEPNAIEAEPNAIEVEPKAKKAPSKANTTVKQSNTKVNTSSLKAKHPKPKPNQKITIKQEPVEFKRSSRARSEVDYSEPSLRKKLRRDNPDLIDAVTEGNYKTPVKNERVPLGSIDTNKIKPNKLNENNDSIGNKSRRYTMMN